MATLNRMRNHGIILLVVVGLALLAFIVGDFLNSSASIINAERAVVAKIDGEKISANDFSMAVNQMQEVYKIEMGMSSIDDELNDQIHRSVWETMVGNRLLNKEAASAGMQVCKAELKEMLIGNNIHPLVSSRRAFFNPETGTFDPALLSQFIMMLDSDDASQMPSEQLNTYRLYWNFWETTVKNARLEEKYNALLTRSMAVNALEAKYAFDAAQNKVDIVCAVKPYYSVADSLVSVSDNDAKALYNQKKEQYKQEASADLAYVAFAIEPSKDDFAAVEEWINGLKNEFTTTDDIAGVTNSNSDVPYKGVCMAKTDLADDLKEFAFSGKKGDVVGPLFSDNTYKMARIVETGMTRPDSVKVRFVDVTEATMADAQVVADSLQQVLAKGGEFAEIQKKFRGAEAWAREGELDREVVDKVFTSAANAIFQQKSMGGIRIFQVLERGAMVPKVKLAVLERRVVPSSRTQAEIYQAAKQFAAACQGDVDSLKSLAAAQNIELQTANRLNINSSKLNSVKNSRQVVRWAFEAKEGDVSDVFECDNQHIVAGVSRLAAKGYNEFENLKMMLTMEARNNKKAEKLQKDLAGKTIDELRAEGLTIDTISGVSFAMPYAPSVGSEPALFAMAPLAEVGKVSEPIKGQTGVLVFQVVSKADVSAEFDEKEEKTMLTERMRNGVQYLSMESLRRAVEIEDERYKFF